jgi:hypothetical protein
VSDFDPLDELIKVEIIDDLESEYQCLKRNIDGVLVSFARDLEGLRQLYFNLRVEFIEFQFETDFNFRNRPLTPTTEDNIENETRWKNSLSRLRDLELKIKGGK